MSNDEMDAGIWTGTTQAGTEKADEVLAEKIAERRSSEFNPDTNQELEALRAEVDRLRGSLQEIASSSRRLASAEFDELKTAAEEKLKQNVFLSVGVAALVGYLWGRSRR